MESNPTTSDTRYDPTGHHGNCGVGVVADLEAGRNHAVVSDSLTLLENLEHRGTTGAEADTGDGAGIMIRTPREFFGEVVPHELPETYAVGTIFFPRDKMGRRACMDHVESRLEAYGLELLHWRDVPRNDDSIGETACEAEPAIYQCFVTATDALSTEEFDRALYVARRAIETSIHDSLDGTVDTDRFYICSLDRRTVVYKGLLTGSQLSEYYPDLTDERVRSSFAIVHARFSTNTLGAWHLAHPYRSIVHNGEFNTLQGNVNWMRAREGTFESDLLGSDLETVLPVIDDPEQSDTATVDNTIEFLLENGRSLPHALRMVIPEAWRDDDQMHSDRKAWYDYHASVMEPWDGPALVVGTDGKRIGAVLDRNGLRPCRYDVTEDGRVIMASEVGALEHDPREIEQRNRLEPGQLFLVDPEEGRILEDDDVFEKLTDEKYGQWVDAQQETLSDGTGQLIPDAPSDDLRAHQAAHGYTYDELENLLAPMADEGKDPIGSMGNDTPLSVMSDFNRPLASYFKQRFAQVTNPAIDHIREETITSLETRLGPQRNLLDESPAHANQLVLDTPILTSPEFRSLRDGHVSSLQTFVVDITYERGGSLESAIETARREAARAVREGVDIVLLSDRPTSADRIPIPALLATSAVHHHLVREGLRSKTGLVVDSGDPRTVHQVATVVG
ncbi:MAG: glutamate synthase central domain-containing protein, partial [Halodesulfurarchaeum sp.]